MSHSVGEDVSYLLTIFNGLGYMIVFVLAMIWLRLLLRVVEYALAPLGKNPPSLVSALSEPSDLARIGQCEQATGFCPTHEKEEGRRLCA